MLEHAPWSPGLRGARVIDLFAGSGALRPGGPVPRRRLLPVRGDGRGGAGRHPRQRRRLEPVRRHPRASARRHGPRRCGRARRESPSPRPFLTPLRQGPGGTGHRRSGRGRLAGTRRRWWCSNAAQTSRRRCSRGSSCSTERAPTARPGVVLSAFIASLLSPQSGGGVPAAEERPLVEEGKPHAIHLQLRLTQAVGVLEAWLAPTTTGSAAGGPLPASQGGGGGRGYRSSLPRSTEPASWKMLVLAIVQRPRVVDVPMGESWP